ncbi:MAG: glycosyltransferase, partial [Thiotrichaceae bacterium]|nr:glycosyltransferase [Thiotrichaceae bacterium]
MLLIIVSLIKRPLSIAKVLPAYKEKGILGVKICLLSIIEEGARNRILSDKSRIWHEYKKKSASVLEQSAPLTLKKMQKKPLISIVLPTYNTPVHFLQQTIQSIIQQYYDNWELCIVDDASTVEATRQLLEDYCQTDNRIKVQFNTSNKRVSATTNRAIASARGDYIVFCDHDDILEPQALLRIAEVIELKKPDFIYSDEVLISQNGQEIVEYYFRPTLSKERLRGHPYIVHLIAFERQFLQQLGGLDEKLMISQDYDLILRSVENTTKIVHIPEILYQWRQVGSSAGFNLCDQVMDTSINVLQRHLQRCGEKAAVYGHDFFNFFDIRYPVPQRVKIGIIIPTKNQCQLLKSCIESIEKTTMDIDFDIIVINHQSDQQETLEYLKSIENKHQIINYQGEFNFSKINNTAVKQLSSQYTHLLFCNNDIQAIEHNWLSRMLEL